MRRTFPKITEYTLEQIKEALVYDPDTGNFYKRSSGKLLGGLTRRKVGTNYWRIEEKRKS